MLPSKTAWSAETSHLSVGPAEELVPYSRLMDELMTGLHQTTELVRTAPFRMETIERNRAVARGLLTDESELLRP